VEIIVDVTDTFIQPIASANNKDKYDIVRNSFSQQAVWDPKN
jgi:hypothetical protein